MHATIHHLTGDAVIYRDLEPCDPSLPRLSELQRALNLPLGPPPRKRDAVYAQMMCALAQAAQAARSGPPLAMFAVLGDTDNDRLLAAHLRDRGPLPCFGFIGEDRPVADEGLTWEGDTANATRWHLAERWAAEVEHRGGDWTRAAVLIDIDKTLLGPRGRSDGAIDDARAEGAAMIARQLLAHRFELPVFRRIYAELCHKQWHGFTLDNQDYVVASALLLATRAADLEQLRAAVASGDASFAALLDATTATVCPELAALHAELRRLVAAGDPTPFKAFRRAELVATLARMGDGRLTLCRDLFVLCARFAERGALLLAASDKPAESALPSPEQLAAGMLPLHRTSAQVV
jgi:hypothetical protein